jgi:uncharacterized UPF0146 family protein
MTLQYAAGILGAMALAATLPASERQDPRPRELPALRLRPATLALFINQVAGLRVRVINGVVDDIASPRVFTLKNERSAVYPRRPNQVAIVLDSGRAVVRVGAPVVVTGIARTLLGAESNSQRPFPVLTESERKAVEERALVMASSVDTPDGVHLVRPDP